MRLMNQLERRLYRYRIQPFFRYLIFAMAGIAMLQFFIPAYPLISKLFFIRDLVFAGEVWRIVSFLIIPPSLGGLLQIALMLYFYYFIGTALESRWGARRFLLYYLIGALAAILAGLITGFGVNEYLYLSMFFAFAIQYPDFQLLLFFMLPIKVKWLAAFNAVFIVFRFFTSGWPHKLAIVFSLLNLILFFGGDLLTISRQTIAQWQRRRIFKQNTRR